MEFRDKIDPTHVENKTIKHVSHEQYGGAVFLNVQQARTMSGEFPNLSTLIASELKSLDPQQVPKLITLNARRLDLKLEEFPNLEEVYSSLGGWQRITEEMRENGWHYQNGILTQPLAEKQKAEAAANIGINKSQVANALAEIYGQGIKDVIKNIVKYNPDITQEQLIKIIEQGATCEKSSFFRESNISALVDLMKKDKDKHWEVLSAGCAHGPEPHQLGAQLMDSGVENFHIDGIDINPESIIQAKSGQGDIDIFSTHDNFFREMAEKGILKLDTDGRHYELDDKIKRKMSFKRHDLIDSKAEEAKSYDIVICNNVLQHFPQHTRELILIHVLENLKDGGVLALERDHWSFNSDREEEWLAPYYEWKKHLEKFGLTPTEIENSHTPLGSNIVFHYEKERNEFKDGTYGIRDEKLKRKVS